MAEHIKNVLFTYSPEHVVVLTIISNVLINEVFNVL